MSAFQDEYFNHSYGRSLGSRIAEERRPERKIPVLDSLAYELEELKKTLGNNTHASTQHRRDDLLREEDNPALWSLQCSTVECASAAESTTTGTVNEDSTTRSTREAPFKSTKPAMPFSSPVDENIINNSNRKYSCTFHRAKESPMEPPANVQSPPFRFYSPAMTAPSTSNNQQPNHMYRQGATSTHKMTSTASSRKDPRSRLFYARANGDDEQGAGINGSFSSRYNRKNPPSPIPQKSSSEWQPVLQDMKSLLEAKDAKIRTLQDENDYLRSQLHRLQQTLAEETSNADHQPSPTPFTHLPVPLEQEQSPKRGARHTKQQQVGARGGDRPPVFSPGTQLVADLASVMEIEVGHHAPLSFLIDKHWDRVAKYSEGMD